MRKSIKINHNVMLDSFSTALRQMELADHLLFGDEFSNRSLYYPNLDIIENEEEWLIFAELPGVKKEDISISINDSILKLSAKREQITVGENSKSKVKEIRYGKFERKLKLGSDLDPSTIDAKLENGILNIRIPKNKKKIKEIEIKIQ
jgi:HSP20 family protein